MFNLALVLTLVIAVFFLWKKGVISEMSLIPISIFVLVSMTSLIFGLIGGGVISGGGLPPLEIYGEITSIVGIEFAKSAFFLVIGSVFFGVLYKLLSSRDSLRTAIESKSLLTSKIITFAIFIISSIAVLIILNSGTYLLYRETYLIDYGSLSRFYGNLHYLIPILALTCFWLKISSTSALQSFFLNVLLVFTIVESLASASRALPLIFLSIGLISIYYKQTFSSGKFAIHLVTYFLLTIVSYGIVLDLRLLEYHGLIPYLDFLTSQDFISYLSTISVRDIFGNLFSIIPITYLGLNISAPDDYLSISLTPALGETSGWYQIARYMTVNPWTPTGAVAQVASISLSSIALAWIVVGAMIEISYRLLSSRHMSREITILAMVITLAASVQFLQYSLRAGMRFLYLQLFLALIWNFKNKIQIPLHSNSIKPIHKVSRIAK